MIHDIRRRTLVAAVVVAFVDQASTSAVAAVLGDHDWSSGPLRLAVVRNPGGPFGRLSGDWMFWTVVTAMRHAGPGSDLSPSPVHSVE